MFDSTNTATITEVAFSDQIELYRKRRRDAGALWCSIDPADFNMASWTNCALAWLGQTEHGGWTRSGPFPSFDGSTNAAAAAKYFAIGVQEATECFCTLRQDTYYPMEAHEVVAEQVAHRLMSYDYNIHPGQ
jgi:hypothetical protein